MSGFSIEELDVPETIDDPAAGEFREAIDVGNVVAIESFGTPDIVYEADEDVPQFRNPYQPKRLIVARVDGRIGRALADRVEDAVRADGGRKAIAYEGAWRKDLS